MAYTIWGGPIESYETSFPFPMKHKKTRPYYKTDGQTDQQWNVTPLILAFGGQQFIVAHCGSPSQPDFLSLSYYFAPDMV